MNNRWIEVLKGVAILVFGISIILLFLPVEMLLLMFAMMCTKPFAWSVYQLVRFFNMILSIISTPIEEWTLREAYDDFQKWHSFMMEAQDIWMQIFVGAIKHQCRIIKAVVSWSIKIRQKKKHSEPFFMINLDGSNQIYRNLFSFLENYFGYYRVLPGMFLVDKDKIVHIRIKVGERVKDGLTMSELALGMQNRLINALSESEDFSGISSEYWGENTVLFKDVEQTLPNEEIVAYIALSNAGMERLRSLQSEEEIAENPNETIE